MATHSMWCGINLISCLSIVLIIICPDEQVQAFYEGLNDSNKAIVDSACNGMLMKMSDEETIEMCEELVENSQQFNTKGRQAKRGAYAVNANDGMQVEMAAMNRNIAALIKTLSPQSSQQALKFDRNVLNPSQGNTQLQGIAPGFSELKKTSLEDSIAVLAQSQLAFQ
ncbi:hypothetical protein EV2_002619 [Malus domestica]